MKYKIALVGNPNCGKTTLFNELTGSNQYVGNWPGVTVEQKSGRLLHHENEVEVIDLPGIYSLSTYSLEEVITRDYIENEAPDVIINIVDASNLERNLFLTLQLTEMGCPMVIALNMMDVLKSHGEQLDVALLEQQLGLPIMPIVARRQQGTHELIHLALDRIGTPTAPLKIYSSRVESLIDELERGMNLEVCKRMHAVRFIDEGVSAYAGHDISEVRLASLNELVERRIAPIKLDRDMIISDEKYKFITAVTAKCLVRAAGERLTLSDKIDKYVTNRILAIPIFLAMMMLVFFIAFGPFGSTLSDGFSQLIELAAGGLSAALTSLAVADWARSLLIDGIFGGVGAVLSFLPQIAILFLMLSVLEDSGYMARAAFIMDRLLRRFGLSGRSFIPMLMGFGCTVPALMAARTLENEQDRRLTMMITPFMSCSARLPVYAMFGAIFFPQHQAVAIFSMYILGIVVAVLSGLLLKRVVTRGRRSNFIMELPEYRCPTPKNLWLHTWEKIRGFITKAGTVLVIAFIVIWFLQHFDLQLNAAASVSDSIFGAIGRLLAPLFAPLGFGNWAAGSALLTGLVAKEAVVGTFGMLGADLQTLFTPASAIAFMCFTLLYTPCIAALATLRKEMNSLRWTGFAIGYQLAAAWVVSFVVYNIARLIIG